MRLLKFLSFIFLIFGLVAQFAIASNSHQYSFPACSKTAKVLKKACGFDARDDFLEGIAICLNISSDNDRKKCFHETFEQKKETSKECREVFEARRDVCKEVGEEPYEPEFGPDFASNFVDPLEIGNSVAPNTYLPLVPGNQWVYEGTFIDDEGEEETETITVTVTNKTKLINGINCIVVNDVVVEGEDEELVEDTDDWFAQDLQGNVWYCGEISKNFEFFEGDEPEEAELVDVDGSWKAGRDGGKAGIIMPAVPQIGEVLRQEVAWGDAEDVFEILSNTASETTPAAACNSDCLLTRDFTPLDPGVDENKYYAPGIGLILEVDLETNDRVELIEFSTP